MSTTLHDLRGIPILPIVPMSADALDLSAFYIWKLPAGPIGRPSPVRVVSLIPQAQDGLVCHEDGDEFYFRHNLKGTLHGPFFA